MFHYAEPIKHEGLSRTLFGPQEDSVHAEIKDPYTVRVATTSPIEGVLFRFSALIIRPLRNPDDVRVEHVQVNRADVNGPGRRTAKVEAAEAAAREWWAGTLEYIEEKALALLDSKPYASKQQEIEAFVRADLTEKVDKLVRLVAQLRERVAEGWLEPGSESTASMGNMDLAAAKAMAHLAAATETYDACYGPYVSARSIANELTHGIGFRVSLYV